MGVFSNFKGRDNSLFFQSLAYRYLQKIEFGRIEWCDIDTSVFSAFDFDLSCKVKILNKRFYRRFILGGSIGAAESYLDGDWDCDDLVSLFKIILLNEKVFFGIDKGFSAIINQLRMFRNILLRRGVARCKRDILHHYDLSNKFFSLFLDESLFYSSGVFHNGDCSLSQAQENKTRILCEKLDIRSADHILEIGSGWGGFAIYAVKKYNCKVTTTTISDAQYKYVKDKIFNLGLSEKIEVLCDDYRNLKGQYNKIVSIEMIESIGHKNFSCYFKAINRLLLPKGRFVMQSITINDKQYSRYKREVDFIKKYIFPGGCLPCMGLILKMVKKHTSMQVRYVNDIGKDYARTLHLWHENFLSSLDNILKLGFDRKFIRMFLFYFQYCEAAFLSGYIGDVQVLMEKD